jgi:hypothetical protein
LHVRIAVPTALGVEAHLVNAGAAVDVVGARFAGIPAAIRERVLARYPRHELKAYLIERFGAERARHPSSRMSLWVAMGFLDRIAAAPFEG